MRIVKTAIQHDTGRSGSATSAGCFPNPTLGKRTAYAKLHV
jgi:hypothetical protein